jgi:hypothetical protein
MLTDSVAFDAFEQSMADGLAVGRACSQAIGVHLIEHSFE